MGEAKDLTDQIYANLMDELDELGYENISTEDNNAIVDLIDATSNVADLIPKAIKILTNN